MFLESILTILRAPHEAVRPPVGGLHRLTPVVLIAAGLGRALRDACASKAVRIRVPVLVTS